MLDIKIQNDIESNTNEIRSILVKKNEKIIEAKKKRREEKKKNRRGETPEEVIYIFEKILEGWRTIKIYNTLIQTNKHSEVSKKNVENISTGNCKVYESELDTSRFQYYNELRNKVYEHQKIPDNKKIILNIKKND
jgi:hypothetical protein